MLRGRLIYNDQCFVSIDCLPEGMFHHTTISYQLSRFELPLKAGSQSVSQAGARIEPRCVFLAIMYIACCTYLPRVCQ